MHMGVVAKELRHIHEMCFAEPITKRGAASKQVSVLCQSLQLFSERRSRSGSVF